MIMGESFGFKRGVEEGQFSLAALNSLTKYPSIETYHQLGAKGILREYQAADFAADEQVPPVARFVGDVEVTEKVDGTNARLIILPDGMVIVGSREELLWATGDLIFNPALDIVNTLQTAGVATAARAQLAEPDRVRVVYGEVYGSGIGSAGKRYSAGRKGLTGFRVFDVASVPVDGLVWSAEEAANWRHRGGQRYEDASVVEATAHCLGVERVPSIRLRAQDGLPDTIENTRGWLSLVAPRSRVALAQREGELASAEGVVLRGRDAAGNRLLAKIRYEDYDRTLRERAQAAMRQPRQRPPVTGKPLKRTA